MSPIKQFTVNAIILKESGLSEDEVSEILDHIVNIAELYGAEISMTVAELEE
jgi:hypothetical protein